MIQTLLDALSERGYDNLTPVQEAVTAPGLEYADLLVSAQTGSGKTVGFGLAIGPTLLDGAETLGEAAAPLALIVAPTRELAFQVTRELSWLYAGAGARVVPCVGGMDMRDERRALERGAHIVVGTPGRLTDHIRRGSLDMTALRAVVLDEADEMLDLGFREDLEFMLGEAPDDRRTLMFSATVPPMIATLAQHYQRDALRVTTTTGRAQHADIAYQVLSVAAEDTEGAVINLLRFHEPLPAIVFANTRATVNRLTARFANRGFAVVSLSGELSQAERGHALQAMRDGRARVCVATDVAARGIDLPNLGLVIHAELPSNAEGLLHRSGRTGRAGRKGISALVVPPKAVKRAERLLKTARVTAEWTTPPDALAVLRRDEERLLADPAWDEDITPDEADFAARLLAERSPQEVAAAVLRLHRARHSAPEVLSDPDDAPTRPQRPERTARAPFGPSAWIALSVGRAERAEPRWLLPLLCRAGGLTKDEIGAIRVGPSETLVEIAEGRLPGFLDSLGEGGALEDGVTVRAAEAPGQSGPARATGPKPRGPRAEAKAERASEAPIASADVPRAAPAEERVATAAVSRFKRPKGERPAGDKRHAPREARPASGAAPRAPKGASKPRRVAGTGAGEAGPKRSAAADTSKRFTPPGGTAGGKPGRTPDGKAGRKPGGTAGGKPGRTPDGKAGRKPGGTAGGKPGRTPDGKAPGKPGARAGGKGSGKPGARAGGKGGDARPMRPRREG